MLAQTLTVQPAISDLGAPTLMGTLLSCPQKEHELTGHSPLWPLWTFALLCTLLCSGSTYSSTPCPLCTSALCMSLHSQALCPSLDSAGTCPHMPTASLSASAGPFTDINTASFWSQRAPTFMCPRLSSPSVIFFFFWFLRQGFSI